MIEALWFVSIVAIILGILFFIVDYYKAYNKFKIHKSLIAGFAIAYFFYVVLPEVSEGLPEFPLHLRNFEYMFVLIGFSVNHIVEKLILQKVESKSQKRARELISMQRNLEAVEDNIENTIDQEIVNERSDMDALKELARTLLRLKDNERFLREQIEIEEQNIKIHLSKDLEELRFISQFVYHFLIGLLLINVLLVEFISGLLLFVFAFFMALIMKRDDSEIVFSDLPIEVIFSETKIRNIVLSSSAIMGIVLGIILDSIFQLNIEFIYLLYSFVVGVMMYTIIRDMIPEKEIGKPLYFVLGIVVFSVFIFILKLLHYRL